MHAASSHTHTHTPPHVPTPPPARSRCARSGALDRAQARLAANARDYARGIAQVLRTLPRDLLLVLKLNDCVRAVEAALGCPGHNFAAVAREARRAQAREARADAPPHAGLLPRAALEAALLASRAALELRLAGLGALLRWGAASRQATAK
jgi:hypothetical protein